MKESKEPTVGRGVGSVQFGAMLESAVQRLRRSGRSSALYALRLAVAAAAAFAAGSALLPGSTPVLSALTALLVVSVTVVDVVANSVKRVVSVVLGVLIAIGFSYLVGLTWWSLAIVVAIALMVGKMLRLGDHVLEIPISAMLVLAVGGAEATASDRIIETLIGGAVGVLVSFIAPPQVRARSAAQGVARLGSDLARLVDRAASGLVNGVTEDEAERWLMSARRLSRTAAELDAEVAEAEQSRRLNPRALGHRDTSATLRGALDALEHSTVAVRSVFRSTVDAVRDDPTVLDPTRSSAGVRPATVQMLTDLGSALRAFSSLVRSEVEGGTTAREAALRDALTKLENSRLAVERISGRTIPGGRRTLTDVMLEGVDRVLAELDADEHARRREARRLLDYTQPMVALKSSAQRLVGASHAMERPHHPSGPAHRDLGQPDPAAPRMPAPRSPARSAHAPRPHAPRPHAPTSVDRP